jgi:hypothetical protein
MDYCRSGLISNHPRILTSATTQREAMDKRFLDCLTSRFRSRERGSVKSLDSSTLLIWSASPTQCRTNLMALNPYRGYGLHVGHNLCPLED